MLRTNWTVADFPLVMSGQRLSIHQGGDQQMVTGRDKKTFESMMVIVLQVEFAHWLYLTSS